MLNMNDLQSTEYLGDGVYAGHDGFQFWLFTHDGVHVTNAVALEPMVYQAFDDWVERIQHVQANQVSGS